MWSLITACLPGSEISLGVLVEITVEACYCSGRGSGRKGAEVDGGQTTVLGNGVPTGGSAHFRFAPFFGRDYIRVPRLSGGNSAKKKTARTEQPCTTQWDCVFLQMPRAREYHVPFF